MTKEYWVQEALTNDTLVAELLSRLKRSPCSGSLNAPPLSTSITQTKGFKLTPCWGHRKIRSKPTATVTNVKNGIGKEERGSPTTHLSWSGGGASTSDGYDESSRPSDLSSGGRSAKANEGASTSGYNNKSHKRKNFAELKDEEGSLMQETIDINQEMAIGKQELASIRVKLNQEMGASENLKGIKIDMDHNRRNEMDSVGQSCRVEAEQETGFVLPDLNMMPNEEDLAAMMA